MFRFWNTVIHPLLELCRPKTVLEIGSDHGYTTFPLASWSRKNGAQLHVIDPLPKYNESEFIAEYEGTVLFHKQPSLEVLSSLGPIEIALIDGDHNWYTVYHELTALHANAAEKNTLPPICILHDTLWPYGRRDLYYNPDIIPESYRHLYAKNGMLPGQSALTDAGFNRHLCNAEHEGGEKNGVLCAVEDFNAAQKEAYTLITIPVYHGLTMLLPRVRLKSDEALRSFAQARNISPALAELISAAEVERVRYYNACQHAGIKIESGNGASSPVKRDVYKKAV